MSLHQPYYNQPHTTYYCYLQSTLAAQHCDDGVVGPAPLYSEHAAVHAGCSQRSNILPEYGAEPSFCSQESAGRADRRAQSTSHLPPSNPLITISLSTNLSSRHQGSSTQQTFALARSALQPLNFLSSSDIK